MIAIPLYKEPYYSEKVLIDNVVYEIVFKWNSIFEYYTFDLIDSNGDAIIEGKKIVKNIDLLNAVKHKVDFYMFMVGIDNSKKLEYDYFTNGEYDLVVING